MKRLSRRTVLRGAGGVALALPLLEAMLERRAQAQGTPRRLVIFFSANGVVPKTWQAQGAGASYTLGGALAPLTPLKNDLLTLSGVDMNTALADGGNEHARGMAHMLTCTRYVIDKSLPIGGNLPVGYAGGISIDQEIANQVGGATKLRSLELGVACTRQWGAHPYSRMSYAGRLRPVPSIESPKAAFERLFGSGVPTEAGGLSVDKLAQQRKSVLDLVKEDVVALSAKVGVGDRQRLDQHMTSLRELERGLGQPAAAPVRGCQPGAPPTSQGSNDNGAVPAIGKQQMDVLVAALACDLTRVASLQWSSAQSSVRHEWVSVTQGHHSLSHEGNSNAAAQDGLSRINRWFAEQFAYLGTALKARAEAGGSLLDNTVVLWCSEVAVGNSHSFRNLPFVLMGKCGGAIKTGQHLDAGGAPHNNLMVALGKAMGAKMDTFGDPKYSTGVLPILT